MTDNRLLKQLLYRELTEGQRTAGGQMKSYKDVAKNTLKAYHLRQDHLKNLTADRQNWRADLATFEGDRLRQQKRHQTIQETGVDFICPGVDAAAVPSSVLLTTRGATNEEDKQSMPSLSNTTDYFK